MAKVNLRLDAARKAYREALDAARTNPSPEAWARLLAAGKELSAAEEPRPSRAGRRTRRTGTPSYTDLEGPPPAVDPPEAADEPEVADAAEPSDPEQHEFEQVD